MNALRPIILEALSSVRADAPYALVDYPNYLNPGDAAIWLGARMVLGEINGRPPAYSSTLKHFSAVDCRAAIGKGTIYFLGGGNFGDLYPRHHLARLDVIEAMRENPIVQLPSSCAWRDTPDREVLAKTRRVLARHADFRFFARERKTESRLREFLDLDSVLCPDLAHALEFSAPAPSVGVQAILRRDIEAVSSGPISDRSDCTDWRSSGKQQLWNRVGKLLLMVGPTPKHAGLRDWVARRKTLAAAELAGRGKVLVTNRLHAFLIGAGIGRTVVVLDNSTGKVLAYLDSWRRYFPHVYEENDLASAQQRAERLSKAR